MKLGVRHWITFLQGTVWIHGRGNLLHGGLWGILAFARVVYRRLKNKPVKLGIFYSGMFRNLLH